MKISNFYKWVLRYIAKRIVVQGPYHQKNITEYYRIIHEAAREEFYEDNLPTLNGLLTELHEKALPKREALDEKDWLGIG